MVSGRRAYEVADGGLRGAILALAALTAGTVQFSFRGRTLDPFARAGAAHGGARPSSAMPASTSWRCCRRPSRRDFAAARARAGVRTAADDSWGDIFSRVLVERIEPQLGIGRATILYEYPAVQSPLARPKASDPRLAERFELYACGVELANGFGELTDAVEQRRRLEAEMAEKARIYGERYPIDEDFLAALAVMPPASGIALGFDRLVMLATGATRIDQVLWTPMPEA